MKTHINTRFLVIIASLIYMTSNVAAAKSSAKHKTEEAEIIKNIIQVAQENGIPADVLYGICNAESSLDPTAYVYHDGGQKGNHAFGMCQVLTKTAEQFMGSLPGCKKDFRRDHSTRSSKNCKLFAPKDNLNVAAKYIKSQIIRYKNLTKAIAAYNTGSYIKCSTSGVLKNKAGKVLYSCKKGEAANGRYINLVNQGRKKFVKSQIDEQYMPTKKVRKAQPTTLLTSLIE